MIKISLCILAVYLLYYAGNILYDLFLKKEKEVYKEETEVFSLSEISERYEDLTKNVGIEDVENLNTPKSFNKNLLHPEAIEGKEERQDLEHLREQFESEQDIDNFQIEEKIDEEQPKISEALPSHKEETIPNQNTDGRSLTATQSNKDKFRDLLNLAETSVQLISNIDGYKIYQSTM
ncbi:hypothetical protein [Chryseobacterium sp.]|uniref:hypothetical protein n=1 Tax=Chryseobacterium sp. TaxID=1871047 RepID=UPI00289CCBC3|nr:hypothetical protein [Chryseobacterium sp.]